MRLTQDRFGHAAQGQVTEPSTPVRGHGDQVCMVLVGVLCDGFRDAAAGNHLARHLDVRAERGLLFFEGEGCVLEFLVEIR